MSNLHKDLLKVTFCCIFVVFFKMVVVFFGTGFQRTKHGDRAPEDKYQKSKNETKPLNNNNDNNESFSAVERWKRMSANDIENILPGIVIMWIVTSVIQQSGSTDRNLIWAVMALDVLFVVGRFLHSFAYAFAQSFLRSGGFFLGQCALFGLFVCGFIALSDL
mmetsp:Transcript_976/g.1636  ORF Transcript_976/g.1636 Transcript_976/m.1636 type:complete len:163 (+) Transcript_976:808-1296(+)